MRVAVHAYLHNVYKHNDAHKLEYLEKHHKVKIVRIEQ